MHTSKLSKFWHQLSSFVTTFRAGANCKFMPLVYLQISCRCMYQAIKQEKVYTQAQFKIDPHKLCHLKWPFKNYLFNIYQNTYFYAIKQKKWKKLCWLFSSKKTVIIKWHTSEHLIFQNLLKNIKLLPAEKFGNTLAFDKKSKRKLLSLISADSLIKQVKRR